MELMNYFRYLEVTIRGSFSSLLGYFNLKENLLCTYTVLCRLREKIWHLKFHIFNSATKLINT